ncbi:predicted protein [Naegleria gruberi]|uniref:Predicted protein n=1 Tax=Naegleria gruberi TaxID=5762 RepID=D2W1E8_NAEGR|nr:uncharacterized protein NAEGRDRAFT_53954 [Naegleria gruberi]EFC37075.1 predicted protein [Naegleria gruberi]|eukprot:XP_002669819.1 predicted protein [Naegleria gruberi strain NEG-M]
MSALVQLIFNQNTPDPDIVQHKTNKRNIQRTIRFVERQCLKLEREEASSTLQLKRSVNRFQIPETKSIAHQIMKLRKLSRKMHELKVSLQVHCLKFESINYSNGDEMKQVMNKILTQLIKTNNHTPNLLDGIIHEFMEGSSDAISVIPSSEEYTVDDFPECCDEDEEDDWEQIVREKMGMPIVYPSDSYSHNVMMGNLSSSHSSNAEDDVLRARLANLK